MAMMETRDTIHPEHAAQMGTEELRRHFLIQKLFTPDQFKLLYTCYDRIILGGVSPLKPISLEIDQKLIASEYLLERREMGIINIGGDGAIIVDEQEYALAGRDALYIGRGSKDIVFKSNNAEAPAKFYLNCAPAHSVYPTAKATFEDAEPIHLGEMEKSNKRTIRKYIHPEGLQSCQLVMGMTTLEKGCIWNTMPVHTHPRRIEAYFYFDLPDDELVFHFMGKPDETRHIVVRNEEAVLSPSWSIHSGAGTGSYTFIWGMAGENQAFGDMDGVRMNQLK
jgi:4-deoxy-L-threo-5-hexosulose-uronate ketol-isomerase